MQYFAGPIDCVMSVRYAIPTEPDPGDTGEDVEVF
jgi:hypothetical protein